MADFRDSFPKVDPRMKIRSDLDNRKHGPHHDVFVPVSGGTDQTRVTPDGEVIGGTTNIGKAKKDW